jgi:polysaccharide export outer membrane protein
MNRKICPALIIISALSLLAVLLPALAVAQPQSIEKSVLTPTQNPNPINSAANPSDDDSYRVGPGDVLEVRVFGRPELGREQRIGNRGAIRLPFLEDIQVACKTEAELAQLIAEKYKKYLRDPQIDVFVKEYNSQPVAVIGSVAKPGRFQLQRRVRLLELLTFSGGPIVSAGGIVHIIRGSAPDFCEMIETGAGGAGPGTPVPAIIPVGSQAIDPQLGVAKASPTNQQLSSPTTPVLPDKASIQSSVENGEAFLLTFNLKEVLIGNPDSNPYVLSGDIISIPETDQVFVVGQVVKPGPLPVRSKITLMQAIGMAGGFTTEAAKNKVKVVRTEPGTNARTEFIYDLNDIQKKRVEDIALMPNDVVDVPSSLKKNLARSFMNVGFGLATTLPLYIIP